MIIEKFVEEIEDFSYLTGHRFALHELQGDIRILL